jgi:hypothetical protein
MAMKTFRFVTILAFVSAGEAAAQPRPGQVQPDRIPFGTVHVGATAEASFMVLTPGKDAKTRLEVTAPAFVKVLRTTTDTQEYGRGNTFVRGSVEVALRTAKAGLLRGQIAVKLGPTTATVHVSAVVKPQRAGLMRLLVAGTPFNRFSTQDGNMFKPWTDLVAGSPWDVSYRLLTPGQPAVPDLAVGKAHAILLDPEALCSLTPGDVKRVRAFAESGGLVLVAANYFFRGSAAGANKVLVPYGLEMRDEEQHLGPDNLTLGKAELDPQVVKAGIESAHFYRASPVAITNGTTARALVRAANVGQPGDAFVATVRAGKGNVVALGQSLWWNWVSTSRDPSGGNARLLHWVLNTRHERRQRVVAFGRPLTAAEVEGYWKGLASEDADEAAEAIAWLTQAPEAERRTLALLRRRLKAEPPPNPERLRKLIADLAADDFAVREAAQRQLEKLGDVALPALRKEVKATSSAEVRRRAGEILKAPQRLSGDKRRALRGVDVLDQLGTADARQHLATLAQGAPGSRLTEAARAALERLASPGSGP